MRPIGIRDQREPAGRLLGIGIEMLMRYSARSYWQQYEIARFPIVAVAVYESVAGALENKNRQAALVSVLAGMALYNMLEGLHGLQRSEEHTSELQSQSNLVC